MKFLKFFSSKKKPKAQSQYEHTFGDAMIVSMVAAGATFEELKQVFPEQDEAQLRKTIQKACDDLGLFPD